MNIIICSDGIKRAIHGSFSICGSKEDLETVVYFIEQSLHQGFGHGWIDIHSQKIKSMRPEEAPFDWYQEAN